MLYLIPTIQQTYFYIADDILYIIESFLLWIFCKDAAMNISIKLQ